MVPAADLCLEAPNHLRVDFTSVTCERTTKAIQIPHGMTFAVLEKVIRSHGHLRTMPVGKSGNETGIEAADGTFDAGAGKGWSLSPVLAEDLAEQARQQATNGFH
jgi:hypothetical protein